MVYSKQLSLVVRREVRLQPRCSLFPSAVEMQAAGVVLLADAASSRTVYCRRALQGKQRGSGERSVEKGRKRNGNEEKKTKKTPLDAQRDKPLAQLHEKEGEKIDSYVVQGIIRFSTTNP